MSEKVHKEDTQSRILFPLRTNVHWFETKGDLLGLERRIKQNLILYDKLIFEDGLYNLTVGERGGMDSIAPLRGLPPEMVQEEPPEKPMTGFSVSITQEGIPDAKEQSFIPHTPGRAFFVNFFPVIKRLGLMKYSGIRVGNTLELSDGGKRVRDEWSRTDLNDERYKSLLPNGQFIQDMIVKNLNHNLLFSQVLKVPMSMDEVHGPLLKYKIGKTIANQEYPEIKIQILDRISKLSPKIPDFSTLPIEKILELRKDTAIIGFREKMSEFQTNAFKVTELKELDEVIDRLLLEEQFKEIQEIAPSSKAIVINFLVGLIPIPFLSALGLATDYNRYNEFEDSWVSFIIHAEDKNIE